MGFYYHGFDWIDMGRHGMGWHGMGWGGMGIVASILGLLFFLGLLAVLALVAVWVIRRLGHEGVGGRPSAAESDALDVARRRLAAGEITVDEFEEIRGRLGR